MAHTTNSANIMQLLILWILILVHVDPIFTQPGVPVTPDPSASTPAPYVLQTTKMLDPRRYQGLTPLERAQFENIEGTVTLGGECFTHEEQIKKVKEGWDLASLKGKTCKGSHLLECVPVPPRYEEGEEEYGVEGEISIIDQPSRCNCSIAAGGVNFGVADPEIGCRIPAGKGIWSACNSTQNILYVPLTTEKYTATCTKRSRCDQSLSFPLFRCICHQGYPTNPDGSCRGTDLQMFGWIFYIGIGIIVVGMKN